jgi:hypothetical protein
MAWSLLKLRDKDALPKGVDGFQERLVLSAFPAGSTIVEVTSYRPGYMHYPVRVRVQTPTSSVVGCVLKDDRFVGGVEREARLLGVLRGLGLPVPQVLAGPTSHPDYPDGGQLLVLEEMPGRPLPFGGQASLDEVDLTCRLLPEAIGRLHELTDAVRATAVGAALPARTLLDEYDEIHRVGGPCLEHPQLAAALRALRPALERVATPLVFTNGDYNPINFLHQDGRLTAWLDFTHACFEDPLIDFGKFVAWSYDRGWWSAAKSGLVERFLYDRGLSRAHFAPRLALRCLRLLQTDPNAVPGERYYQHMLQTLTEAMEWM